MMFEKMDAAKERIKQTGTRAEIRAARDHVDMALRAGGCILSPEQYTKFRAVRDDLDRTLREMGRKAI